MTAGASWVEHEGASMPHAPPWCDAQDQVSFAARKHTKNAN